MLFESFAKGRDCLELLEAKFGIGVNFLRNRRQSGGQSFNSLPDTSLKCIRVHFVVSLAHKPEEINTRKLHILQYAQFNPGLFDGSTYAYIPRLRELSP